MNEINDENEDASCSKSDSTHVNKLLKFSEEHRAFAFWFHKYKCK